MNAMQIVLIGFQLVAAALLIAIGGIPDRKAALWYLLTGGIFLVIAALLGFALKLPVEEVFSLQHPRISLAVPLSLGYPFLAVGILALIKNMRPKLSR